MSMYNYVLSCIKVFCLVLSLFYYLIIYLRRIWQKLTILVRKNLNTLDTVRILKRGVNLTKEDQRKNIKASRDVFEVFSERCKALDMTQNELLETLLQEEVERTTYFEGRERNDFS